MFVQFTDRFATRMPRLAAFDVDMDENVSYGIDILVVIVEDYAAEDRTTRHSRTAHISKRLRLIEIADAPVYARYAKPRTQPQ
ncbi:hypothetical protein CHU98_g10944 [Xylaria longipes]|nr:hypothetical protein CHU98_g10944 [Xylaria longipes]